MRKRIECVVALAANPGTFNPVFEQLMKTHRFLLIPIVALATNIANAATDWTEKSALKALAVTAHERAEACQALAVIGGPKSVPVLADLLDDEANIRSRIPKFIQESLDQQKRSFKRV